MASAIGKGLAIGVVAFLVLAVFGLLLEVSDSGEDVVGAPEETSTESLSEPAGEPEPAPEPEAPAEPDSGPVDELDLLSQECSEGDVLSCDALYWLSPVGSEHEAQGEPYALLLLYWEETAVSEQAIICDEWTTAGAEAGTEAFLDGYNSNNDPGLPDIRPFEVETFFNWACATTA